MSHGDSKVADHLGIVRVKPDVAIEQLVHAWRARMPVCLIGPTGQGKSACVSAAAQKLLRLAQMGNLDWRVPTQLNNWAVAKKYEEIYQTVADRKMTSKDVGFSLLTTNPATKDAFDYTGLAKIDDVTGTQSYYRPTSIPSSEYMLGIWQITEMNRPAAKRAIRPLLDVFQSRIIDEHVIPPGINIVADFNEGDIYDTEELLDPFFIRRASFIYVENDYQSWRKWMENQHTGDLVTRYLDSRPAAFDNDNARRNGQVYACAATWTRVQEIIDALGPHAGMGSYLPLLSGMLRKEIAAELLDFVKRGTKIDPRKILENYYSIRPMVLKCIEDGHGVDYVPAAAFAALDALAALSLSDPMLEKGAASFAQFFADLPLETAQSVTVSLTADQKKGGELTPAKEIIHRALMAQPLAREKLLELMRVVRGDGALKVAGALGAAGLGSTVLAVA